MQSSDRFPLLDGARGLGALAILYGHMYVLKIGDPDQIIEVGVDFFFMLSGFVLAHAYGPRLRDTMSVGKYLQVRAVRLFPLIILGALLGTGVTVVDNLLDPTLEWWRVWISGGLAILNMPNPLLPSWGMYFPFNGPAWSLFFELVISLAYAPIARYLSPVFFLPLTVVFALAFIWASMAYAVPNIGWDLETFPGGFLRAGFGFFCGLFLHSIRAPVRRRPGLAAVMVAVILLVLTLPLGHSVQVVMPATVIALPVILYLCATIDLGDRAAVVCDFLGRLSYPLYITHYPLLRVMDGVARRVDPGNEYMIPTMVIEAVVCLVFAWFAMALYDEPVRRWIAGRLRRPKAVPAQ
jgi:peptidoglycan/LPS O-acetylase OafA/YrhL